MKIRNKTVAVMWAIGAFLSAGLITQLVTNTAEAKVVAAAQMKDGVVVLTDQTFELCPEGSHLAVAVDKTEQQMPGCWVYDKEGGNIVVVWISPEFKIPTGAFKQAPQNVES